jgi:hypothetical protein
MCHDAIGCPPGGEDDRLAIVMPLAETASRWVKVLRTPADAMMWTALDWTRRGGHQAVIEYLEPIGAPESARRR